MYEGKGVFLELATVATTGAIHQNSHAPERAPVVEMPLLGDLS
jgi:hypothetical protein